MSILNIALQNVSTERDRCADEVEGINKRYTVVSDSYFYDIVLPVMQFTILRVYICSDFEVDQLDVRHPR